VQRVKQLNTIKHSWISAGGISLCSIIPPPRAIFVRFSLGDQSFDWLWL